MGKDKTITVSGVTFTAADVVSAVVKIDGREIYIQKKTEEPKKVGFGQHEVEKIEE